MLERLVRETENLADLTKRTYSVSLWKARFDNLPKGRSVAKFCTDHRLDASQISHAMAGRRALEWETIKAVEDAMTKEKI